MFKIEKEQNSYLNYHLLDCEANTKCTITPEKGGMCTSFTIDGEEMIYINEENYYSDLRTRCAIPILFPTLGVCENEQIHIDGKSYPMGIHGIAHGQTWEVIEESCDTCAQLTIRLSSNETTLKSYPYHFTFDICYRLKDKTLEIGIQIHNHEAKEMPFTIGFHPYFKVSNTNNLTFSIPAKTVQDKQGDFVPCTQIMFPYAPETKVTLGKISSPCKFIDQMSGHSVTIQFEKDIQYIVLWSLCEQNFICMEPWSELPNALNEGKGQIIEPQSEYKSTISITFAT